jgi:hypothetical protein
MVPFTMNHRASGDSRIDLSALLSAPAGRDGFIRVQGPHFVAPDGKRVRFWGVNLTDWSKGSVMVPPKHDAPVWAAALARFGVNCVRLHFLDLAAPRGLIDPMREDSREFDVDQLDREDFFIAELKRRGIYVNLNLNVGRSYKADDGVRDPEKIRWAKGLTFFDPRLIELQQEYARKLLTHYNPYTKSEYRNEPAVAIVEIANENALYVGFTAPTPYYDEALTALYNAWLRNTQAPERLEKLRALTGVADDAAIPRLKQAEVSSAPDERFDIELSFYTETEGRFFRNMQEYLKGALAVKSAIVATADHSHSGSSYPLLMSTSLMDVVDGHTYWQHPGARGNRNTPMVNDPFNSTVVELSRTAFADKPYIVSEVNHPYPNEWGSEGIPILAAYASFHDWDGIFWYTFEPKLSPDWMPFVADPYDISHDPVKMAQLASGALLFLRGDVKSARTTVERSYSRELVYRSVRLPQSARPYFTPGFPLALPLRHGSRIRTLQGQATTRFETIEDANPIVTDTGELSWYVSPDKRGRVLVDTDRSQAVIGYSAANGTRPENLRVDLDNEFSTVVLSSLDGQPISSSGRMLLTAGARVANTGMTWNATRTALANWGGAPSLIEAITGHVVLQKLAPAVEVRATPLDGAGRALGESIPAAKTEAGWAIALGKPATTWYEVTVRRASLR